MTAIHPLNNSQLQSNVNAASYTLTNVVDPSSDQDVATKAYVDDNAFTPPYSYISGLLPTYVDADTVTFGTGDGFCGNSRFVVTSSISVDWTFGEGVTGFAYAYIDYDASTFPNDIVIIGSTDEPSKNTTYNQWMLGDDRCVGAFYVVDSAIKGFVAQLQGINIEINGSVIDMALSINPDGTWQTPPIYEGDEITPVNAIYVRVLVYGQDTNSHCAAGVTTTEMTGLGAAGLSTALLYNYAYTTAWGEGVIPLGPSRTLKVFGANDDDNNLYLSLRGYIYER